MKKFLFLMALSCIALASCSDDNEDPTQALVNEIQGKWIEVCNKHFHNMDDYLNNAKPAIVEYPAEDDEFRGAYMIENNQLILGLVKEQTLHLAQAIDFISNDGKQIKTKPTLGGDGNVQYTLEHIKNDTLVILRTNTMNPMVRAEYSVRTDLPVVKKY